MKQRKEMINQTFKSSSTIRRVSFELRKQMILSPTLHLLVATLAGAFMIGPLITSLFILQTKFYSDNKLYFTDAEATDLKYSDFLKPILIGSSLQICFITLSFYGLVRDIVDQGLYVWNRDNLGYIFQYLMMHVFVFCTIWRVKLFVDGREQDKTLRFIEVCHPVYWLVGLYALKVCCIRSKFDWIKIMMAISLSVLMQLLETYMDSEPENDSHLTLIAVPTSIILIGQAALDVLSFR